MYINAKLLKIQRDKIVYKLRLRFHGNQSLTLSRHALARTRDPALSPSIHRGRDEFKAAKHSSLIFYEKVKQRKLACGIRIVLHNVECLCLLLLLNN